MKPLVIEHLYSRNYNILVDYKTENGEKVFFCVIQHKLLLNKRAIIDGTLGLTTYRVLKRLLRSGKTQQYETECKKIVDKQCGDEEKMPESIFIPENKDIYVVEAPNLSPEQFDRLKGQIDSNWPTHLTKPIILEGEVKIRKLEFAA
jgi:hypothetical protein